MEIEMSALSPKERCYLRTVQFAGAYCLDANSTGRVLCETSWQLRTQLRRHSERSPTRRAPVPLLAKATEPRSLCVSFLISLCLSPALNTQGTGPLNKGKVSSDHLSQMGPVSPPKLSH